MIDLHRHLEGSVRFDTFRELARELGLNLPVAQLRRRTTMKGEKPGFKTFLSKFELYRGIYPSRDWIERVAFEAVEDAAKDGVAYLELRFSPTHFGRRMKARGEDVAEWVAKGARRAGIDVRFIATFGRDFGPKGNEATRRAVEGTDLFSGLDLAGDESVSALPFLPLFKMLGLPSTIHAGEGGGAGNVREAIERFGARRIGHGLRVLEDPDVVALALEKNVVFEVCPTSELQTGVASSVRRHPVKDMLKAGLRLTVNTDDPSVCGTTLSREFALARKVGFNLETLRKSLAAAVDGAFLTSTGRRILASRIADAGGSRYDAPLHR